MVNCFSAGVSSTQQISWPVRTALASAEIFRPARWLCVCQPPLLRSHLPRRRRRVDEIAGELLVARLGVLDRLVLDRAVAADAIRQRQYFYGGVVGGCR